MTLLNITTSSEGAGKAQVSVEGEIDWQTHTIFAETLTSVIDKGATSFHIDLRRVTFIDSVGMRALIGAHRRISESGGVMTVSVGPVIWRVFQIAGLDRLWKNELAPPPPPEG